MPLVVAVAAFTGVSAVIGSGVAAAVGLGTIGTVAATAIGTAVISGGITAIQGGSASDVLKSAVLGGVGSYIGGSIGEAVFGSAGSGVSQAALEAANATTDPIAALNAIQGWTTSDIGYLASIGASDAIINAAMANNAVLTSGQAAETAIPKSAIDAANLTDDPIAALNASQGWTASDIGYLFDINAGQSIIDSAIANNIKFGIQPTIEDLGIKNWVGLDAAKQTELLANGVDPTRAYQTADGGFGYMTGDGIGYAVNPITTGPLTDDALMRQAGFDPTKNTLVRSGDGYSIIPKASGTLNPDFAAKLNATQFAQTNGIDTSVIENFQRLGYSEEQILSAINNNPNGGFGGQLISQQPGAPVTTAPVGPTAPTTQIFDDGSTLTTSPTGQVTSTPATDIVAPVAPTTPVTTTPTLPSGPTITQNPDGSTTQIFDDGSTLTTSPTGQVTSTPATDTVTTGPTVPSGPTITQNPDGSSTQVFDDGSTLTTKPDGTVTSTPATDTGTGTGTTQVFDDGSTLTTKPDGTVTSTPATDTVTPGVPVVDAVPTSQGTNNTLGNSNPSVLDAGGRWTAALLESVGLAGLTSNQILALMAAGALAPSVLQALGLIETPAAKTTSYGPLDYTPLPAFDKTALAQPGLNPGLIPVRPYYQTTNEMQPQYYWGKAPYIGTAEDVSKLQNIPGAPATPFGYNVKPSSFDVDKFIRETITPQQSQALAGAGGNYQIVGGQPVQQAAPVTPEVIGNKVVAQTPVADKFTDFYASPEYQTYQTQLGENPIGTMDVYESPYFGFQGSGSIGRAQDRAYEQYLSRVNPAAISSPVNPVIPDALPNAASAVAPVAPQQVIVG